MSIGKGATGAASGAAIGSQILPGWGTAIGAGLGFLGGMFSDDPQQAPLQIDPASMAKLQEDFPEYAKQIQQNQVAYGDLSRAVANQQQGPSAREQAGQQDYMNQMASAQAMGGNQGNPLAQAAMNNAQGSTSSAMYDAANQRAMSALAMQQQAGGALAGQYGNLGQLQNAARQGNISNAQHIDDLRNNYARYGTELQNQQDHNNWQGMLQGAAGLYQLGNNGAFNGFGSGENGLSAYQLDANAGQGPLANEFYKAPSNGQDWFNVPQQQPNYQTMMPSVGGASFNSAYGPTQSNPRANGFGFGNY